MSPHDESALPWERAEKPTPATLLQERLEGQQVAFLHYLDEPGPTGSRGIALELTTGAKLIIFAGRDRESRYAARLFFRWMDPPRIIVPRLARAFSMGRDGDPTADPADALQRRIEGLVIHGVLHTTALTRERGEQMAIDFRGGARLALAARPIEQRMGGLLVADLLYVYSEPERSHMRLG